MVLKNTTQNNFEKLYNQNNFIVKNYIQYLALGFTIFNPNDINKNPYDFIKIINKTQCVIKKDELYIVISDCITQLIFNYETCWVCYLDGNIIQFRNCLQNEKNEQSVKGVEISLSLEDFKYKKQDFEKLTTIIQKISENQDLLTEKDTIVQLLKLSKKIPFNAYNYCDMHITSTYFEYKLSEFLEHKANIVLNVIKKLNDGINTLLEKQGIQTKIKLEPQLNVKDITQKKNSFLSHDQEK